MRKRAHWAVCSLRCWAGTLEVQEEIPSWGERILKRKVNLVSRMSYGRHVMLMRKIWNNTISQTQKLCLDVLLANQIFHILQMRNRTFWTLIPFPSLSVVYFILLDKARQSNPLGIWFESPNVSSLPLPIRSSSKSAQMLNMCLNFLHVDSNSNSFLALYRAKRNNIHFWVPGKNQFHSSLLSTTYDHTTNLLGTFFKLKIISCKILCTL